ncbi:MAG TPA: glycosyltransferase [Ignavibacteriaceae bacterium]|nr:glycosyltransferase [Ignavibacteriaceae bacterium]
MKIVVSIMKYDYGYEERGFSYEYYNVYLPLCDVFGKENVLLYDYYSEYKQVGKEMMNKKLKEIILRDKPDVAIFCLLWEGQFDEEIISSLRKYTKTIIYFFDDPWRQKFVRHWIKYFDYFSTPDYYMFQQYRLEGIKNVIYSPFGFNSSIYKKLDIEKKYDVSFIGGYSPFRNWVKHLLEKEGIRLNIFGRGWGKSGRWISQDEMIRVFNQSKINLNLSNSSSYDISFLIWSLPSFKNIKQLLLLKKNKEQVKGRHFEINACGGFQLSYFIPSLNQIYEIDKEIAVYEDVRQLPGEIKFFLNNDELRNSIANRGYEHSQREHTAQLYLKNLVEQVLK